MTEVERQNGALPKQAVVDEGYLSRATVLEMDPRGVELMGGGSWEDSKYSARSRQNGQKRGVSVDPAVGLDLEASAGGGDVHSDLPLTITGKVSESNLRGTLGKGGELLRLHSAGGDISVRPL